MTAAGVRFSSAGGLTEVVLFKVGIGKVIATSRAGIVDVERSGDSPFVFRQLEQLISAINTCQPRLFTIQQTHSHSHSHSANTFKTCMYVTQKRASAWERTICIQRYYIPYIAGSMYMT